MVKKWVPTSKFGATVRVPEESRHPLTWWVNEKNPSAPLWVFVLDDAYQDVIDAEKELSRGSDAFPIRMAIETAINHEMVAGVAVLDFNAFAFAAFKKEFHDRIENQQAHYFLDLMSANGDGSAPPGITYAKLLIGDRTHPTSICVVSNESSPEVQKLGIEHLIDKPKATDQHEETFRDSLTKLINEWAKSFQSIYKSSVGVKELEVIASNLGQLFHSNAEHEEKCHTLDNCNTNDVYCINVLRQHRFGFDDLISALTDAKLLPDHRTELFSVVDSKGREKSAFELSKCLSDYGQTGKERAIPGHWIGLILGDSSGQFDPYEFPIRKYILQPTFGFLHSLSIAKGHWYQSAQLEEGEGKKVCFLRLGMAVDGDRGSEGLCNLVENIFQNNVRPNVRPNGSQATGVLQAMFDAGVTLSDSKLSPDKKCLNLMFELRLQKVRVL